MSDRLFDDDAFLIDFPLWLLVHPGSNSNGIIQLAGPSGEIGCPVFTDHDLGTRFQNAEQAFEQYELGQIQSPEELLSLLDILQANEFTHVTVDPNLMRAMFIPIDQLRKYTHQASENPN